MAILIGHLSYEMPLKKAEETSTSFVLMYGKWTPLSILTPDLCRSTDDTSRQHDHQHCQKCQHLNRAPPSTSLKFNILTHLSLCPISDYFLLFFFPFPIMIHNLIFFHRFPGFRLPSPCVVLLQETHCCSLEERKWGYRRRAETMAEGMETQKVFPSGNK